MSKISLDAKSFNKILYGLIAGIIALTIAISAYFVVALNSLSKEVAKKKYTAENNNKKIEALVQLDDQYKQFYPEVNQVESYLPEKKEVSNLLRDLESMAQKNGLDFNSYQVGNGQITTVSSKSKTGDLQLNQSNGYTVFPFQIILKGSYAQVDTMIKAIEGYNRLTEIMGIKYNKDYNVPGDAINANLTINAYLK